MAPKGSEVLGEWNRGWIGHQGAIRFGNLLMAVRGRPKIENQSLPEHLSSRKWQKKRCTTGAKNEWKREISLLFRNDILLLFHLTLHYSSFFLSIDLSNFLSARGFTSRVSYMSTEEFLPIPAHLGASPVVWTLFPCNCLLWFLPSRSPPSFPSCFFNRSVLYWRLLLPSGLWKCQNGPLHFQLRK